jgi:hypothetical protein
MYLTVPVEFPNLQTHDDQDTRELVCYAGEKACSRLIVTEAIELTERRPSQIPYLSSPIIQI